jgi:hypothetical protein
MTAENLDQQTRKSGPAGPARPERSILARTAGPARDLQKTGLPVRVKDRPSVRFIAAGPSGPAKKEKKRKKVNRQKCVSARCLICLNARYAYESSFAGPAIPAPKTKQKMKGEKQYEKQLRETVKSLGGVALKFWCVSFTGFPDRMVLMPGGQIHFVELKSLDKQPTPRQLIVHRQLTALGFLVHTVNNQFGLIQLLNTIKKQQHERQTTRTDRH